MDQEDLRCRAGNLSFLLDGMFEEVKETLKMVGERLGEVQVLEGSDGEKEEHWRKKMEGV